jgi:FkbM family methyltransferase
MARANLLSRAGRAVGQRVSVLRGRRNLKPDPDAPPITWVGTAYGGWPLPDGALDADSVVYLVGLGEDASFDLRLIADYGCEVHAFDPVPEAVAYGETVAAAEPRFHFHPYGLWSEDGTLSFFDNPNEGYVSRSATDMHGTGTGTRFEVRSLRSVMKELGHDRVDLLKLSVEGSEYVLIDSLLRDRADVRTLCVEFAQPAPYGQIEGAVRKLEGSGWKLGFASIVPFGWKLTFLELISAGGAGL